MAPPDSVLSEKEEILSLAQQKQEMDEALAAAGGQDSSHLLKLCSDLSDIIGDMEEIRMKTHKKEHAAFDTKVKFSRKMRRKAKDLRMFEQELVQEFDLRHVSLEFGRKMGEIVKLLKSNSLEKAREQAEEFYRLQEMGEQLGIINEALLKKRARIERARRDAESLLSDFGRLEKEPAPDLEKTHRHEQRAHLLGKLHRIRHEYVEALKSMPLPELLKKARDEGLYGAGFPQITEDDGRKLASFLQKTGLESKTAGQLLELARQSEQKLKHLFIDLAEFRHQIAERKAFFEQIETLDSSGFLKIDGTGSDALRYLSEQHGEAKEAADWLSELEKTAGEDSKEWERMRLVERKKAGLAGTEKDALVKSLRELQELESLLDAKPEPKLSVQGRKKEGIVEGILGFFR